MSDAHYVHTTLDKATRYLAEAQSVFIKRQKRNRSDGQAPRFVFYLVEAVRKDGKPRQRNVAYLGSLPQSPSQSQREACLDKAQARIRALEGLDEEERHALLDSLKAKIPPVAKMTPKTPLRQNTGPST